MPTAEEQAFHQAMIDIYKRALKETKYNATDFLNMVTDKGGIAAAHQLLSDPKNVPTGFTALVMRSRMDLTMEAMILDTAEWLPLFTKDELLIAYSRLIKSKYTPKWTPPQ